jgi:hypothetical protein
VTVEAGLRDDDSNLLIHVGYGLPTPGLQAQSPEPVVRSPIIPELTCVDVEADL